MLNPTLPLVVLLSLRPHTGYHSSQLRLDPTLLIAVMSMKSANQYQRYER